MMLYELDDIEKRALVMEKPEIDPVDEARELLANAAQGPLTLIRYEHGGGRLYREEPRDLIADFYDAANRDFYFRAPALLNSLIARIESQAEDIRFLGDRLEVQADVMSKVVAERDRMRDAIEAGLVAMDLLRSWVGPPPTGPYDFDSLREDGWKSSTAAMKQMRDSLSPKGEQK